MEVQAELVSLVAAVIVGGISRLGTSEDRRWEEMTAHWVEGRPLDERIEGLLLYETIVVLLQVVVIAALYREKATVDLPPDV